MRFFNLQTSPISSIKQTSSPSEDLLFSSWASKFLLLHLCIVKSSVSISLLSTVSFKLPSAVIIFVRRNFLLVFADRAVALSFVFASECKITGWFMCCGSRITMAWGLYVDWRAKSLFDPDEIERTSDGLWDPLP